jgi:hypothetical protein
MLKIAMWFKWLWESYSSWFSPAKNEISPVIGTGVTQRDITREIEKGWSNR